MQLRYYQEQAIERVEDSFRRGNKGCFLCLPTGGGKTVIFTEIIRRAVAQGKRCVVVAHRGELIKQAGKTIDRNGMFHGVIKACNSTFPLAPIQVVSIDSMRNRELPWQPDLIVLDEAHLAKANRYNTFLARYPLAQRLLVSATPIRTDGTGFEDIADELIVAATVQQLVDDGYLVPARIFTGSQLGDKLDQVKTLGGDYNQGQLETLMSGTQLVGDIVQQYKHRAMGRKGVVFCVGIDHSKAVAEQFNQAGIRAEHLDGTMEDPLREAILGRLSSGLTQIVTNASVLCEGWDEPSISYVGLARPTKSLALYIQQAGRGLRICPEMGKTDCIINDHGDNVERHGHILEERYWTLDGKAFKEKKKKKYKECQSCGELIPMAVRTCPACNFTPEGRAVNVVTSEFVEVKAEILDPILKEYRTLLRFAKNRQRTPAWAYMKLIEKFGLQKVSKVLSTGTSKKYQNEYYYG